MFSAMLLSNLVAVKLIFRQHVSRSWPIAVAAVLGIGGMFLGAFVQKFAFGEYWTGFPFGTDLTDNKTLIALVTWIIAIFVYKKWPRFSLACAFLIMTTVFLIPHSMAGSERDFRTGKIGSSNILPSAPTPQSGDMK
jgi:cytochrome bd-type quinol oxidase subunit 2